MCRYTIPSACRPRPKKIARKSTGGKPPRKQGIQGPHYCEDSDRASLCFRFADWLDRLRECEQDSRILEAVERDGERLFYLIQRTLDYEYALEGLEDRSDTDEENSDIDEENSDMDEENLDIDEEDSDIDEGNSGRIAHRTKALRDFAKFLRSKTQDGIAEPLSFAIERDGERLFHLASCCLNFTSAVDGEGPESP